MTTAGLSLLQNSLRFYNAVTPEHRGKDFLRRRFLAPAIRSGSYLELPLVPWPRLRIRIRSGDEIGRNMVLHGLYEREWVRLFRRLIRPGDRVLDIGANCGLYTLVAADAVGPSGRVVSFEPAPHKFAELRHNIALNALDNVMALPKAAGGTIGTARLELLEDDNDGMHHLVGPSESSRGEVIDVESTTVDATLEELFGSAQADVMKVDVEGWEEEVFRGAEKALAQPRPPTLLFEAVASHAHRAGLSVERLRRRLEDAGYRLFGRDRGGRAWIPVPASEHDRHANLFAVHPTRGELSSLFRPDR